MENVKNVTDSLLSVEDMLSEIAIGPAQLRTYLKDGRLIGKKVRGVWQVKREDFNAFKNQFNF